MERYFGSDNIYNFFVIKLINKHSEIIKFNIFNYDTLDLC